MEVYKGQVEIAKWIIACAMAALVYGIGYNFRFFLWYLRTLQMIVHLPMYSQITFPGNVTYFY